MIRCVAFALPAPTYAWLHEDELVLEDSRIEVVNGSLFFSRVRLEDGGEYQCLVENTRGQIESFPATLNINGMVCSLMHTHCMQGALQQQANLNTTSWYTYLHTCNVSYYVQHVILNMAFCYRIYTQRTCV